MNRARWIVTAVLFVMLYAALWIAERIGRAFGQAGE